MNIKNNKIMEKRKQTKNTKKKKIKNNSNKKKNLNVNKNKSSEKSNKKSVKKINENKYKKIVLTGGVSPYLLRRKQTEMSSRKQPVDDNTFSTLDEFINQKANSGMNIDTAINNQNTTVEQKSKTFKMKIESLRDDIEEELFNTTEKGSTIILSNELFDSKVKEKMKNNFENEFKYMNERLKKRFSNDIY